MIVRVRVSGEESAVFAEQSLASACREAHLRHHSLQHSHHPTPKANDRSPASLSEKANAEEECGDYD